VAKFVDINGQVFALNQFDTSLEDVLERSLELYKIKHPKQLSFVYLHCWTILKDVPCWFVSQEEQVLRLNL
jgi:Fe-S-cluster formation regulator IscX/YfhJ